MVLRFERNLVVPRNSPKAHLPVPNVYAFIFEHVQCQETNNLDWPHFIVAA